MPENSPTFLIDTVFLPEILFASWFELKRVFVERRDSVKKSLKNFEQIQRPVVTAAISGPGSISKREEFVTCPPFSVWA
jgi:hypothetical protein